MIGKKPLKKYDCSNCARYFPCCAYTGKAHVSWDRCDLFEPMRVCSTCRHAYEKTVIAGDMECEVRFCAFHGKPTLACKGDCKQWDASAEIRDMMRDLGLWTAPFKKGGCADVPSINEKGEEGNE